MAAQKFTAESFVLISTDKAVKPESVMGATKRLSEMILQSLYYERESKLITSNEERLTKYIVVRFGNVLDSSGSVVPLFKQQIKNGGPITITHPDVTRYFMTIPEAVVLVIQAGVMGSGGDIFVLDMGKPMKIFDLADKLTKLSGLRLVDKKNNDGEIEVSYIGLRTGEKMHEQLMIGDKVIKTDHPRIIKTDETYVKWYQLVDKIQNIQNAVKENNEDLALKILCDTVKL
jgi:FlaA1/EpsC-like NDP-sugar epimerase